MWRLRMRDSSRNAIFSPFFQTYLAFAGLSRLSCYICSYTFVMCWKSGTVSFWMGPRSHKER